MLSLGVTGVPADVIASLEQMRAAGADTVYFHLYDPDDLDHVALLGTEVLARIG
jgi:hypothetical protein